MGAGDYWTKCFITRVTTKYCLLDDSGDVRATAFDLESILNARRHYGWGHIFKCIYDGKSLIVKGRELRVN